MHSEKKPLPPSLKKVSHHVSLFLNQVLCFFCFSPAVCLCLLADGSLPKEPRGDVSSQISGKTHKHGDWECCCLVVILAVVCVCVCARTKSFKRSTHPSHAPPTSATPDQYFSPPSMVVTTFLTHLPSIPRPPPHPSLMIGYVLVASLDTCVTPVSVATVCSL